MRALAAITVALIGALGLVSADYYLIPDTCSIGEVFGVDDFGEAPVYEEAPQMCKIDDAGVVDNGEFVEEVEDGVDYGHDQSPGNDYYMEVQDDQYPERMKRSIIGRVIRKRLVLDKRRNLRRMNRALKSVL